MKTFDDDIVTFSTTAAQQKGRLAKIKLESQKATQRLSDPKYLADIKEMVKSLSAHAKQKKELP